MKLLYYIIAWLYVKSIYAIKLAKRGLIELNDIWVRALLGPMHLGHTNGPLCPMFCTKLKEPCSLNKVPDGPYICFLISSGSKKKEPRYVCLSDAKASHSHKMWSEVSSSVPHFLQVGLLLSPIIQGVTGGTDQTSGECSLC